MSDIFSLLDDFEEKENIRGELQGFDNNAFMSGFFAGRYSVNLDNNIHHNPALINWFIRHQTKNILNAEGFLFDSRTMAIKLSETTFSNLRKEERLSIDIFRTLHAEINNIFYKEELNKENVVSIYKKLTLYSLNEKTYDFEKEASLFMQYYNHAKSNNKILKFLKGLLNETYSTELLLPRRLGLVISSRLISEHLRHVRPLFIADIFSKGNIHYKEAINSKEDLLWDNFILSELSKSLRKYDFLVSQVNSTRNKLLSFDPSKRKTSKIPDIIDYLFLYPIVTKSRIQRDFKLSNTAVNKIFKKMEANNILSIIGQRSLNSKFICNEVIQIDGFNNAE